ncbi:hypothetical protein ABMA28_016618, partial [Loxostege sticticalis]
EVWRITAKSAAQALPPLRALAGEWRGASPALVGRARPPSARAHQCPSASRPHLSPPPTSAVYASSRHPTCGSA